MRTLCVVVTLFTLVFSVTGHSQELKTRMIRIDLSTRLRVGVMEPEGPAIADALFLHGFADNIENHGPLFRRLAASGIRVISFDYPSHGHTQSVSIGWYTFKDLAFLATMVESQYTDSRPLFLIGWSTGGLLAARIAQNPEIQFTRALAGMVLYAPGVSVYKIPGKFGFVTEDTLTGNPSPPHVGEIHPSSPLSKPWFSMRLIGNSWKAMKEPMPAQLPILTFVGGDRDVYAKSGQLKKWVIRQRANDPLILGVQCADARHEMDNEYEPLGETVRDTTAVFIESVIKNDIHPESFALPEASTCKIF